MFRYHYEQIKTYDDAKRALFAFHNIRFFPNESDLKKANLDEASRAFYQLQIIVRALNDGWTPNIAAGELGYRPQFYLYDKNENGLPVMKIECKYRYAPGMQIALSSVTRGNPESGKAYFPTSLVVRTPEMARYLGTQFIHLFTRFYYGIRS